MAANSKPLNKMIQHQAYHLVFLELAGVLVLSILGLLLFSKLIGVSLLLGGLAYTIPNLIFVWRVFRYAGAQQMTRFAAAFFAGEGLKLILSGILFIVIVKYLPVSLLSVLVGFIAAIVFFWISCIWYFADPTRSRIRK